MPDPVSAIVNIGGSLISSSMQSSAAKSAASAQERAALAGIEEQRRQFDEIRKLLQPYVEVGTPALEAQKALLGLGGATAQQQAISGLEASPLFQSAVRQGEEALLQQASATGGLRGGNVQAALAQFRPAMLQAEIERQYGRLGGLTSLGQQSAAGVGTAGSAMSANVADLLAQQGAAQAGGALGRASATGGMLSGLTSGLGQYYGATGQSLFSGLGNLNLGTALQYGTTPGSQQTTMLAAQNAGFV